MATLNLNRLGNLVITILAFLPQIAAAQEGGRDAETVVVETKSLLDMMAQGGWAMLPLGLCSLAMFFLIIHSWRETREQNFIPASAIDEVSQCLQERRVSEASQHLAAHPTVLSRSLTFALKKSRTDQADANKEKIEIALVESLEGEENAVGQWINYLNVVAVVSPMIGLLGTVSGMIGAFQTIAHGGMGRPELLAGDIGEALITTATGLVIGIPAMIAYFILRNRLNNIMLATTRTASLLIDYLAGEVEYKSGVDTDEAV